MTKPRVDSRSNAIILQQPSQKRVQKRSEQPSLETAADGGRDTLHESTTTGRRIGFGTALKLTALTFGIVGVGITNAAETFGSLRRKLNAVDPLQPLTPIPTSATPLATQPAPGNQTVFPSSQYIRYVGRAATTASGNPVFGWSGTGVELTFSNSTRAYVDLQDLEVVQDGWNNFYNVTLDGVQQSIITGAPQRALYPVASNLTSGPHTLSISKLTEGQVGATQFFGFVLDDTAKLQAPVYPSKKLLIFGDSISTGYGDECTSSSQQFSCATQSADRAYGKLLSQRLGADVSIVAASGKGVSRNNDGATTNTLPHLANRTVVQFNDAFYNSSYWQPQAIVVNLGTNDFSEGTPDAKTFVGAYTDFLGDLRTRYQDARIYVSVGSLLTGNDYQTAQSYAQDVVQIFGDSNVAYVQLPETLADFGCEWHPGPKGQAQLADLYAAELIADLKW